MMRILLNDIDGICEGLLLPRMSIMRGSALEGCRRQGSFELSKNTSLSFYADASVVRG